METRLCTRCQRELPFPDSFFRDCKGRGGYKAHCKQCDYKIPRSTEAILNGQEKRKSAEWRRKDAERKRVELADRRNNDPAYKAWKAQKDKEYRQTPKGRARLARQKARRKIKEIGGSLTGAQWTRILEAFSYTCAYCGATEDLTVDHFIPLYLGGKTEFGNIVPACYSCNSSKQHKHPQTWCTSDNYARVFGVLRSIE